MFGPFSLLWDYKLKKIRKLIEYIWSNLIVFFEVLNFRFYLLSCSIGEVMFDLAVLIAISIKQMNQIKCLHVAPPHYNM